MSDPHYRPILPRPTPIRPIIINPSFPLPIFSTMLSAIASIQKEASIVDQVQNWTIQDWATYFDFQLKMQAHMDTILSFRTGDFLRSFLSRSNTPNTLYGAVLPATNCSPKDGEQAQNEAQAHSQSQSTASMHAIRELLNGPTIAMLDALLVNNLPQSSNSMPRNHTSTIQANEDASAQSNILLENESSLSSGTTIYHYQPYPNSKQAKGEKKSVKKQ